MSSNQMKFFSTPQTSKAFSISPQTLETVVGAVVNIGFSIGATYVKDNSNKFKNDVNSFEKKSDKPNEPLTKEEQLDYGHDRLTYTSNYKPR